jgi:hypothetical protein
MFEDCHISSTAVLSVMGKPCPPYSGGIGRPIQPAWANCLKASLKPFGSVTLPLSKCAPSLSPVLFSGSSTLAAKLPASSRIASRTSVVSS